MNFKTELRMTSLQQNLKNVLGTLPEHATLVAVSKTKSAQEIMEAYQAGQRIFGENKVQEMVDKQQELPKDIQWHMIGHVQRNKVKYMAGFVALIHSVDSPRLLKEINKRARQQERVQTCLLQVHIAKEDTKYGLDESELMELLRSEEFKKMENVRIIGLMGMATFTEDMARVRGEFQYLKRLFDTLKASHPEFSVLSMGMSGDYTIALEEGSTMVRIGSSIFGERNAH